MKNRLKILVTACLLAFSAYKLPLYAAPSTNSVINPANTAINMKAQNLTLEEALNIVCQLAGLEYRIEGPIVIVQPKKQTLPAPPPVRR
jgi:hypothetical protein